MVRFRDIALLLGVLALGACALMAPAAALGKPGQDLRPRAIGAKAKKLRVAKTVNRRVKRAKPRRARRKLTAGLGVGVAYLPPAPPVTPAFTIVPEAPAPTAPAPAPEAPAPGTPAPAAPAEAPEAPTVVAVGVAVDETPDYRALLSRPSVPAGEVRLQLQNVGEDPHNLRVLRADGTGTAVDLPVTAPGRTASATAKLAAGSYRVFCTLTEPVSHDAAGMNATLEVTPS